MQLTAKLVQLLPLQKGESKNGPWSKQDIIVETDGTYPKKVCISIWGDKINTAQLQEGATLDIQFEVESREYNSKWYTDCKAWKIDVAGAATQGYTAPQQPAATNNFDALNQQLANTPTDDDLPF